MAFQVDRFPVPNAKGPKAYAIFQRAAAEGALRAVMAISGGTVQEVALRQGAATTRLRKDAWLRKVGWTKATAQRNWELVGGAPGRKGQPGFDPIVGTAACHLDHVLELQLGGTNVDENLQVLDPGPNTASGSMIFQYLKGLAQAAYDGIPASSKPENVTLHFTSVVAGHDRAPACEAGCPPEGTRAATCCQIENCATSEEGTRRTGSRAADAPDVSGPEGTTPYPIKAGGLSATIHALPVGSVTNLLDSGPANATAAELIPGVLLETLHRTSDQGDRLHGRIDDVPLRGRKRATRIPVNLVGQPPQLELAVDPDTRKLTLLTRTPQLVFTYPYLSRGTADLAYDPELGFSGPGKLTPSLPLLSSMVLDVALDPDRLQVRLAAPPESLRVPIPQLRFTRAELKALLLPAFEPEGVLAFEVGPQGRPVATGELKVTADNGSLVLTGTLEAHLPRVGQARGHLTYRDGQWSGGIMIAWTQIGILNIQRGQLNLGLTNAGVSIHGEVIAAIPSGNLVTFRVQRTNTGDYVYEGYATLRVPGLHPVDAQIRYDGRTFRGQARTGVDLGPLSGQVDLQYVADGDTGSSELSGEGALALRRGRVNGTFNGKVANSVLTGEGRVWVQLTRSLGGYVGITLDEQRRLRISGGLTVPAPIQLFPRVPEGGGHKELLRRSLEIPILGVSLGPLGSIGLVARISAGFGVRYDLGPGTLDKIQIRVAFNPLEEDAALTADGHAELDIPAHASAYLRLRGALGLSAAVASVTGGVEAVAELGLSGGTRSAVDLHYERGGLALEGVTRISAHPVFRLDLLANVIAEVGALGLSYEWRKDWRLAAFEVGSGWELGLEARIGYSSKDGVRLPAASEIRWIYPQSIDPGAILQALLKRAMR